MCHATSAGRKAGSVFTNKSQFVDTLSTNKAYLTLMTKLEFLGSNNGVIFDQNRNKTNLKNAAYLANQVHGIFFFKDI